MNNGNRLNVSSSLSDSDIEREIERVQNTIVKWAEGRDVWYDCSFISHLKHNQSEPDLPPVVTRLCCEGELSYLINDGDIEFYELVEELGYELEISTAFHIDFYALDEEIAAKFEEYFKWQWICSLIEEDTADVYEELYSHFLQKPNDLNKLHWREFELLLFRVFQAKGFEALIGPGRGDEGVDLRLWMRDPIGDVLTVVQAKKYAQNRKIGQTEVAALFGVSVVEKAQKALFVTSSSYAPVAKRWAARTSGVLELADRDNIIQWCASAERGIIDDKSTLVSIDNVSKIVINALSNSYSSVVHASWGYNMTHNSFALVLKESKNAALLMGLRNHKTSDDGYGQMGLEVPFLNPTYVGELLVMDNVWRAKRICEKGQVSYWDGTNSYTSWCGKPMNFNYCD